MEGVFVSWQTARRSPGNHLLLLGEHVLDQVAHTVAVAKLIVVPAGNQRGKTLLCERSETRSHVKESLTRTPA